MELEGMSYAASSVDNRAMWFSGIEDEKIDCDILYVECAGMSNSGARKSRMFIVE
jgi:hypothetical protein